MRALLSDTEVEVQWIFIHRALAATLLREATRAGDDPALVARASFIMKQPSDAEIHDDHMHVRFYCASADRRLGCVDKGPVRWWKKMWKYMGVPFGRPIADTVDGAGGSRRSGAVIPRRAAADHSSGGRSDELSPRSAAASGFASGVIGVSELQAGQHPIEGPLDAGVSRSAGAASVITTACVSPGRSKLARTMYSCRSA